MKQLIIGLVIGAAVALPATAYAYDDGIRGMKLIYSGGSGGQVYVFDDQDNKCYVWDGYRTGGISCVKR